MTDDIHGTFQPNETVDLLVVETENKTRIVEAPVDTASVGSLVSFDGNGRSVMGEVVEMIRCMRADQAYRCISRLTEIKKATKIYRCCWPEYMKD